MKAVTRNERKGGDKGREGKGGNKDGKRCDKETQRMRNRR
jgi:hypothetical protein